jgi:CDGSH-type Zn-finger protein
MARLVKKEAKGPYEIKCGTESTWICMCGLSIENEFGDSLNHILFYYKNRY